MAEDEKEKPKAAEVQSEELNRKKTTEQKLPDTNKSKRKKYVILLTVGVATTVIAQCFEMHNPSAYTLGGILVCILSQPVSYFVILSITAPEWLKNLRMFCR